MFHRKKYDLLEKKTAEDMHFESLQWISELKFISDEQRFFNHLLKKYSDRPSVQDQYPEILELVNKLSTSKREGTLLLSNVQKHDNELDLLMDDMDQPYEEKNVMANHNELIDKVDSFLHDFKEIKMNVFINIISIMKEK